MKVRVPLAFLAAGAMLVCIAGCGIPEAQHNKIVGDLTSQVEAVNKELGKTKVALTEAEEKNYRLEAEFEKAKDRVASLSKKADRAKKPGGDKKAGKAKKPDGDKKADRAKKPDGDKKPGKAKKAGGDKKPGKAKKPGEKKKKKNN